MTITPDDIVYWQWGVIKINATLLYTWVVMAALVLGARLITRRLSDGALSGEFKISRWQNAMEVIVGAIRGQIREVSRVQANQYLPLIATLFLFIALANLLAIIPGYYPPTASLSTTTALALCVFIAVPWFGIRQQGFLNYLRQYLQPTIFMFAVQYPGRIFAHPGLGGPAVWQHHEWGCHRRNPVDHRAVFLPGSDAVAWTADRLDPGLYFCGVGAGLYRFGQRQPSNQSTDVHEYFTGVFPSCWIAKVLSQRFRFLRRV